MVVSIKKVQSESKGLYERYEMNISTSTLTFTSTYQL